MTIESVESAVLACDDARYKAMIEGDWPALEQLLDDALGYTHSTGAVESKAQYLDALRSGRVKYLRMDRSVAHFHAWTACALMQGVVDVRALVDGKPYQTRAAFTATWVSEGGAWTLAAWAATSLPA